jgi:hypothetical protein
MIFGKMDDAIARPEPVRGEIREMST